MKHRVGEGEKARGPEQRKKKAGRKRYQNSNKKRSVANGEENRREREKNDDVEWRKTRTVTQNQKYCKTAHEHTRNL